MSIKWFSVGQEAVGVIAIGQIATGVIAIGQGATGVIAIGQLARGIFVVGQLAYGVVAVGQLAIGVGRAGAMVGIGGRAWVGFVLGLYQNAAHLRSVWRHLVMLAILVGFSYVVAVPLWNGLFADGGVFNQPLR